MFIKHEKKEFYGTSAYQFIISDNSDFKMSHKIVVLYAPFANCQNFSIRSFRKFFEAFTNMTNEDKISILKYITSTTGKYNIVIDIHTTHLSKVKELLPPDKVKYMVEQTYKNTTGYEMTMMMINLRELMGK